MRRAALLALPALAALPAPAMAQELNRGDTRLDLAATAPAACVLSTPASSGANNAAFTATGPNSGQIAIVQLVDATTASSLASAVTLSLPLVCNASHHIALRSTNGGLVRGGAQANGGGANARGAKGFAEFLPYRFVLAWAGTTIDRASDQGDARIDSDRPASGAVELRVSTAPGQGPLVAGQYSDSIVVEFQPAN